MILCLLRENILGGKVLTYFVPFQGGDHKNTRFWLFRFYLPLLVNHVILKYKDFTKH